VATTTQAPVATEVSKGRVFGTLSLGIFTFSFIVELGRHG
jgi:hypothetical protein